MVGASERLVSANSLPPVPCGDQAGLWRDPFVDSVTTWAVPMEYVVKVARVERSGRIVVLLKVYGKRM